MKILLLIVFLAVSINAKAKDNLQTVQKSNLILTPDFELELKQQAKMDRNLDNLAAVNAAEKKRIEDMNQENIDLNKAKAGGTTGFNLSGTHN